ncbi:ubiquitin thioesterase OTU1 [Apiospora rasikravindrae]|uniref:Ubiquitin thioesterase OTU n=1 Tax=Apiospora rasikravindrae TaxID=990691 RepID=A0ABR1RX35_9PEZI
MSATITVRIQMPTGPGQVVLEDDATVEKLVEAIKEKAGGTEIHTIKYGWPSAALKFKKDEDDSVRDKTVKSLNLHRERLTVVLAEKSNPTPEPASAPPQVDGAGPSSNEHDPPTIRLPTGNDLVLRVMADDNSCMYTAMMPIIRQSARERGMDVSTAGALRQVIGQQILSQPDTYNAAVLEKSPGAYVNNLLNPQSWGGSIELNVLSELFDIEICVVSVSSGSVIYQGEGQHERRCVILWSGIHYDRVVETFFAGAADTGDTEFDVCTWDCATSDHILKGALEMAAILKENNYAHDSNAAVYSCKQCGWVGQGEKELIKHCKGTGHSEIQTIEDK